MTRNAIKLKEALSKSPRRHIKRLAAGSTPVLGSSRSTKGGEPIKAMASESFPWRSATRNLTESTESYSNYT